MKIALNKLDAEDLEVQNFVKFKSKKHRLKGKQSVTQLVSALKIVQIPIQNLRTPI